MAPNSTASPSFKSPMLLTVAAVAPLMTCRFASVTYLLVMEAV
jgi:hypothetical protein